MAQLVARLVWDQEAGGSSPPFPTKLNVNLSRAQPGMTTEHRKAPRRKIIEIRRTGEWGKITYEHVLECGHTEKRPRASGSPQIACAWCLRSQAKEIEIIALAKPAKVSSVDSSINEIEIARVKAKLSHVLSVSQEQIEISVIDKFGEQVISGAVVFLSEANVHKLIG